MLVLTGCATQTTTLSVPVASPPAFSEPGTEDVAERWWTEFEDEQLNAVVDSALASNFDLRTAWQRLRAAQAVVDREAATLFPTLEASAQGDVTRTSPASDVGEQLRLGLTSAYEVDLWGRIRASVEAERFREAASLADYRTAALSLSAEITRTWFQLAEAQRQLALVEDQVETNETVLDLLENRFGTGLVQSVDILRQRQLVASTREQQASAESRIEVLEHQVAVLAGRPPQAGVDAVPEHVSELPPLPETGVPTDLIRRRPDVRSAFHRLQAADRDLAAAVSNQYPRLSLSASASTVEDDAATLFENWALSLAGNVLAPIFLGGELRAEVDRSEAVQRQRLYEYGQTVLEAFREVEDALIQERKQAERIQHIERQIEWATQAYEQLRVQYFNGTADYLDVLTALDDIQQLRRDLLAAERTLVEYRIALYRALAGSFETGREAEE